MKSDQYEPTPDEKRIVAWHRRQARWYVSKGLMLEADCHSAAASAIKCGEHREEQA